MRILHIVTAFPRTESDVITPWLVELLKRQRAAGLEPEVFAPSYKGLGDQIMFGMTVHRFRYFFRRWENLTHDETAVDRISKSWLYRLLPGIYLLAGTLAIHRLCRRNHYDVIQVHWPLPHAVMGWAGRQACGAKLVMKFYGVEMRWVRHSMPFLRPFLAWSCAIAGAIAANSSDTAREVSLISDKPAVVIYDITNLQPPAATRSDPTGPRRILFVGRLVERKGVTYLIEAMAHLPRSLDTVLVIVGEGPERQRLEQAAEILQVNDRVQFAGKLPAQELSRAYSDASVFVLPAIIDSKGHTVQLGVVLLDAIRYSVPIIGSDVGGIPDIIIHEKTGLLVPQKDPAALARAIERILKDHDLRDRLTINASQHLQENFNWDNIIKKWITLYKSIN